MSEKTMQEMQNVIDLILEKSRKKEANNNKVRENKGKSVDKFVKDYCIIDIETTDLLPYAEIIEIGVIKVRNCKIVDTFNTLIKPPCDIPKFITQLTGITNEMVKDAPKFEDIVDDFLSFVGKDVIVGYNNYSFDICVLYDNILKIKDVFFSNDYEDVLYAARRSQIKINNYSLETVCDYYGFNTDGEHRALNDCYLTKKCYDKLYEEYGENIFKNSRKPRQHPIQYTSETLALKELELLVNALVSKETFGNDEIEIIKFWLNKHDDLKNKYPFYDFNKIIDEYDINKSIKEVKHNIQNIINPIQKNILPQKEINFTEKHVCLTGNFLYGSKSIVEDFIKNKGGIIDKAVRKKTDYLIVGGDGNKNWIAGNYGSKVKKAIEFNNHGGNIQIIDESEVII